jgi:hypothetical protein
MNQSINQSVYLSNSPSIRMSISTHKHKFCHPLVPAGSYAFLSSPFPIFKTFFKMSSGMLIHCASYFTFSGHHKPVRLRKRSHSFHLVTLHSTKSFNKSCTFSPTIFYNIFRDPNKYSIAPSSHNRPSVTLLPTIQVTNTVLGGVLQWHTQFSKNWIGCSKVARESSR